MNLSNRIFDRIADSAIVRSFNRAVDTRNWTDIALAVGFLLVLVPILLGIFIAAALAITLLYGWSLHILWGWFAVPLGMPAITAMQGAGIMVVTGMLARGGRTTPKITGLEGVKGANGAPVTGLDKVKIESGGSLKGLIAAPMFTVAFGWVLHSFM